ncbi:MAG: helix-turn-helix domain-containing protein [Verrucomicrobiota bacterium]
MSTETFADKLAAARRRAGLTQAECGKILEKGTRTVERWEAGELIPAGITQEGALARLAKLPPLNLDPRSNV